MKQIKHIFIALLSFWGFEVSAQFTSDWALNDAMFFRVNPAFVAIPSSLSAGISHARKWRNLSSSPTQSNLGLILPFTNERMGIGVNLFSEETGPFKNNGMALSYAYHMPLQKSGQDRLSLGAAVHLRHIAFDPNHLLAAEEGDPLLGNIEGNRFVPPSLSVGFHYLTGTVGHGTPVQFVFAGSISQFIPFQSRFNSLSFDLPFQWHGLIGLEVAASEKVRITPMLLLNQSAKNVTNYGLRVKTSYSNLGWVMAQYSKAGFLSTQLGVNLASGLTTNDVIELSGTNTWAFGFVNGELGNGLTIAMTYRKSI